MSRHSCAAKRTDRAFLAEKNNLSRAYPSAVARRLLLTGFSTTDRGAGREPVPSHDTPRLRGVSLRDTLKGICSTSAL